ncbi:MAG: PqqD family protein [Clostridia bacterium]|nr:PqqD family protein [Clostridia bacterium]
MKLKGEWATTKLGDEYAAVSVGEAATDAFHGIIRLNETAGFIVKQLQSETTREALIDALEKEYEGTREQFAAGVDKVLTQLRECGAIEE